MLECCSSKKGKSLKHDCPANGEEYKQVPYPTVLSHLKKPWRINLSDQTYFFCDDPNCEVVYFGEDDTLINKDQLRTKVGIKETSIDALICYCFDVSRADALSDPSAKAFVTEQTKKHNCACAHRNPSGRCCLKDFPA